MENELRTGDVEFKLNEKSDREAFMNAVDRGRANTPYVHYTGRLNECCMCLPLLMFFCKGSAQKSAENEVIIHTAVSHQKEHSLVLGTCKLDKSAFSCHQVT